MNIEIGIEQANKTTQNITEAARIFNNIQEELLKSAPESDKRLIKGMVEEAKKVAGGKDDKRLMRLQEQLNSKYAGSSN